MTAHVPQLRAIGWSDVRVVIRRWFVPSVGMVAVAGSDLASKAWAAGLGRSDQFGPGGVVQVRLMRNRGAALGLGTHHPVLVTAVAVLAAAAVAWALARVSTAFQRLALAMVLGGAVGNLIDRAMHAAVTDWLRVWPYPATFNLADLAIRGGVLALLVLRILARRSATRGARGR